MSKKKKSKKENTESVNLENNFLSMVCLYGPPKAPRDSKLKDIQVPTKLYGPPKDFPRKKSKKTKNEKDDKEK